MDVPFISDPDTLFQDTDPKFVFAKPELSPSDPKYYEVTAVQVTAVSENSDFVVVTKENPDGEPVGVSDWIITRAEAVGAPGSFLMQSGPGRYNIISAHDLAGTYVGMDDVSRAKLAELVAK